MKTTIRYIVLIVVSMLLYYGCFWKWDCGNGKNEISYTFYLPFTFSPTKDTFKINDTIHIHANFSDQLFDSTNLKYFKVENFIFDSAFTLAQTDTVGYPRSFSDFNIMVDTGQVAWGGGGGILYIKYVYQNNRYKFHARLIPLKKGVFKFSLVSSTNQEVDLQENCSLEYMDIFFTTNGGAANNFHLLAESPEPIWNNITWHEYVRNGYYVFRVVE